MMQYPTEVASAIFPSLTRSLFSPRICLNSKFSLQIYEILATLKCKMIKCQENLLLLMKQLSLSMI